MRNCLLICRRTSSSSRIRVRTCCTEIFFFPPFFSAPIRSAAKRAHEASSRRTRLSDLNLYDSFCKISILITFTGTIFLARGLRSHWGQQAAGSHRNQSPTFPFLFFLLSLYGAYNISDMLHTSYIAFPSCFYVWSHVLFCAGFVLGICEFA